MNHDAALEYVRRTLTPYFQASGQHFSTIAPRTPMEGTALMVSPHPDDESINASLALRLKNELGFGVVNFPFSMGSNTERRPERKKELEAALTVLGFSAAMDTNLFDAVQSIDPKVVIFPHARDGHPTHERTAKETEAALQKANYTGFVARWEFWQPSEHSNLLLEVHPEDCATQVQATAMHAGEVRRNPYHLRLPFWMMENTRRGSEKILGNLANTSDIALSTLHEWARYENGKEIEKQKPQLVRANESIVRLFQR